LGGFSNKNDSGLDDNTITVAFAIGPFATVYFILSIILCSDLSCPYCTLMIYVVWYIWNGILFLLALGSCLFLRVFLLGHLQIWPDRTDLLNTATGSAGISSLDDSRLELGQHPLWPLLGLYALCRKVTMSYWKHIANGIKKSIINKVISIQDSKLENIAAKIIT
jgi:hypothetical protein